jgi:hypothetical protein
MNDQWRGSARQDSIERLPWFTNVQSIDIFRPMSKVTRRVASGLGVFAGFGGPEHGYFEIQQGHVRPGGLLIHSIGPPCDPEKVWHLCEPAMTIIPSFLVTGLVATTLGLITMIWSIWFLHRRLGGIVLGLLSVALLLAGGGLVPPLIGMIGAAMAGWCHRKTKDGHPALR